MGAARGVFTACVLMCRLCEWRGALHTPGPAGALQRAGGGAVQRRDRAGVGASA